VGDIEHLIEFPFTNANELLVKTVLSENGILAFPTETYYGLGGNALSEEVIERVYNIKERPRNKPLLLLTSPDWLSVLCQWDDSRVTDLMETFWPGPLTLILAGNAELPEHLQYADGTLAVRYSSSLVVQSLIKLGNCPIIGTSANRTGMSACLSAKKVTDQLNDQPDLVIDGGESKGLQASTIVSCMSEPFKLLRHGAISLAELNRVCKVR